VANILTATILANEDKGFPGYYQSFDRKKFGHYLEACCVVGIDSLGLFLPETPIFKNLCPVAIGNIDLALQLRIPSCFKDIFPI